MRDVRAHRCIGAIRESREAHSVHSHECNAAAKKRAHACMGWILASCLLGCVFDRTPLQRDGTQSSAVTGMADASTKMPRDAERPNNTSDARADAGSPTMTGEVMDAASGDSATDSATDASTPSTTTPVVPQSDASANADASITDAAPVADANTSVPPTTEPPTVPPPASGCSREELRMRADAYLQAMAMGNPRLLNSHPDVRYTENGETQALGLGLWLSRPTPEFSRHVLDETRCSSVTEAVLSALSGRTVFGVRLRYMQGQLLEVEAQVVPRNTSYYDPDALIPAVTDPWVEAIPSASRTPQEALMQLAERYFDAAQDESLLPPHAPGCKRRQNGTLLEPAGNCGARPGTERFEQRRYPVIDEVAGIVTAIVMYERFVGMYLFKVRAGVIQNIEVVGGASTSDPGW